MPGFSYRAIAGDGQIVKGVLEGESERQVRAQLRARALRPVSVRADEGLRWPRLRQRQAAAKEENSSGWWSPRLNAAELNVFTRQLATLVRSGMPLAESLDGCAKQARRPRARGILLKLKARVLEGHSLAYALGEYPRVFSGMYQAMVKAGEHTGHLGAVLERLADYSESRQYTQQKLAMAMIYPLILMLVAVSVITLLMVFVVPQLVSVFIHTKTELPLITRILIGTSYFLRDYGMVLLLGLIGLAWGFRHLLQRPQLRSRWHRLLLRLPLVGGLQTLLNSARFAATLSMLSGAGVPLLEGLRIAAEVVSNVELRRAATEAAIAVEGGGSLGRALAASGHFPPLMVQMVASGEASGSLDEMLDRAALNQERELEMTLGGLMSLLEPLMVVVMAAVVGSIVMAILLPILEMNNLVT